MNAIQEIFFDPYKNQLLDLFAQYILFILSKFDIFHRYVEYHTMQPPTPKNKTQQSKIEIY